MLYPIPPPTPICRLRKNLCTDDSALFSRFFHAYHDSNFRGWVKTVHVVLKYMSIEACRRGGRNTEPVFVNLIWSPGIDSQPGGPVRQPYFTYRPARLNRLVESITGLLKRLQILDH
jgi:hypothetical protein